MCLTLLSLPCLPALATGEETYAYDSVAGDPMHTRIYTLPNGLRVYLTQNPDQPRIQTYVAVRAGGKNDPHESTGLAHYLEHLMFKGTTVFGSLDYERERPLLDSIRAMYEVYGHTTDEGERRAVYHHIDSLSHEASRFAIANEYDKLMAAIGSNGSNAYTDVDVTCYTEDIPANEVERWARVEGNRFQDMVIRGFHTELEAVYEEYNIYLTRDFDKVDKAVNEALYPHHPYGMQTVIGKQEHLKNPSLSNVLDYYRTRYVPNNVAICLSGDMEKPDSIVGIIDRYFGDWQPNEALPHLTFDRESPLSTPVVKEVMGRESEMVCLAWPFPGAKERTSDSLRVVEQMLSNGKAGLMDIDLVQSQQLLAAQAFVVPMSDYSTLFLVGMPKEGQTLEEVRALMLGEVAKLGSGDFDEGLTQAVSNNMKRARMEMRESNQAMAGLFVRSFINGTAWQDEVEETERLSRLSKQDIVDFSRSCLGEGYVCVYKRVGDDPEEKKIDKPEISPIELNRESQSRFVDEVVADTPREVSPKFLDFTADMSVDSLANGNSFLYKLNQKNGLFRLCFTADRGTKLDPRLAVAAQYIQYLGTDELSPEALQRQLYALACDVSFEAGTDRTTISIEGLAENMDKAVALVENWLRDARPDKGIYDNLVADILKARSDEKLSQRACFGRLVAYAAYGADNPLTHQLTAKELQEANPSDMLSALRSLADVSQTISYYGPLPEPQAKAAVEAAHSMAAAPTPAAEDNDFVTLLIEEPQVLLAPYEAKNIYMSQYSADGQTYDPALQASIDLFNEYFGGGMNTVVFQELRESRGLAYSASAFYRTPRKQGRANTFATNIITQNDKMGDCLDVFHGITEEMPLSPGSFSLAKTALLSRMATERVIGAGVLDYYVHCRDLGLTADPRPAVYQELSHMTLDDLARFHKDNVQGRTYTTVVLGDEGELDMERLAREGAVKRLSLEDIFGY